MSRKTPGAPTRVLVTGADQHQGLAVIRGLGKIGMEVIAAGAEPHSLGFYSRYASGCVEYCAPRLNRNRFVRDVIEAARHYEVDIIVPAVESTMAALVADRKSVV